MSMENIRNLASRLEKGEVARTRRPKYNLKHIEKVLKALLEADVVKEGRVYYRRYSATLGITLHSCNALEEMGIEVERHWSPLDTERDDYTVVRVRTDKSGKPLKPLDLSILEG